MEELVEKLRVIAPKADKAWVEYMTWFWHGDAFIPQCVRSMIVDYSAPDINITEYELVIGKYYEFKTYIGYVSSDGKRIFRNQFWG